MNTIQFLNENSIEELQRKGIKSNYVEALNVYILNYEQIPPSGAFSKNHPVIVECRNLVLRDKPWRIVGQSFVRFFNWNEDVEETKRMSQMMAKGKVTASVKLDGSLIMVVFDPELDRWHIFTRGSNADGNPFRGLSNVLSFDMAGQEEKTTKKITRANTFDANDSSNTFGARVRKYLDFDKLDRNFVYVFEICTPCAHITRYETEFLSLLMVRDKRTGREIPIDGFDVVSKPETFTPTTITDVYDRLKKMPVDFEGYVLSYVADEDCVVDERQRFAGDVIRMKVKSDTYVALHHVGTKQYTLDDIVRIVVSGEMAEVVATIPEYKEYLDHVSVVLDEHIADILDIFNKYYTLSRRDYAPLVKDHPYAWFLFEMHSNNDIKNHIKQRFAEVTSKTSETVQSNSSRVINSFKKAYYPDKKSDKK